MEVIQTTIYDFLNKKHNSPVLFKGNTTDRGEWLKYRVIGASAIHNLVEVDRYKKGWIDKKPEYSSPFILYKELKGEYQPEFTPEMQDKLDFGHFAEDFIRSKFLEKAKLQGFDGLIEVQAADEVIRHPYFEFATCTPDGWISNDKGEWIPLECKTGDSWQWDAWSGDTIPDKYYAQCQWILEITGKPYMYILGWINNRFTKVFTVQKDQEFINYMFELASNFWENFKNNIEPELIGNKIEASFLGINYQIPVESKVVGKTEMKDDLIKEFTNTLQFIKEVEEQKKPGVESFKIKLKKEMLDKKVMMMDLGNGLIAKLNKRGAMTIQ